MSRNVCSFCQEPGNKKCSICKIRPYCSKDCQVKDWQNHKKNCVSSEQMRDMLDVVGDYLTNNLNNIVQMISVSKENGYDTSILGLNIEQLISIVDLIQQKTDIPDLPIVFGKSSALNPKTQSALLINKVKINSTDLVASIEVSIGGGKIMMMAYPYNEQKFGTETTDYASDSEIINSVIIIEKNTNNISYRIPGGSKRIYETRRQYIMLLSITLKENGLINDSFRYNPIFLKYSKDGRGESELYRCPNGNCVISTLSKDTDDINRLIQSIIKNTK